MERLSRAMAEIDAVLADGAVFCSDPAKATALAKARAEHAQALANAEHEWLEAGEALQNALA